jgi:kynurenine formamidase
MGDAGAVEQGGPGGAAAGGGPLPSYDELPVREGLPAGSSWGLWGEGDRFGCLNLLTPERARRAAGLVCRGAVFPLNLELELVDPPMFNRRQHRHTVTGEVGKTGHDDLLDDFNTQASSQWDGFRHVLHPEHGHYGGVADEDHGIDHWARRGIVGRAVLVDVGRYREADGRPLRMGEPDMIEPADVLGALEAQGTTVETGDVLLLRTGWVAWYRGQDEAGRRRLGDPATAAAPGLRPGREIAALLWDLHIAAVASDAPALEVWPIGGITDPDERAAARAATPEDVFVHTRLLPLLGLPIGELWELEALADDCAGDGVHEAMLTSAPLNLRAGVASPPNAIAIK